jgi:hypothetical protein
MVYINNCCRSNDFSGTCFGEQLLRKENGGAIGVIGATNETLWEEDYYWAVGPKYPLSIEPVSDSLRQGAFDRMLYGGIHTMGELLHAGNMAVMASGTRFSRFYWEIYCLLGDPTLMPRLGAMQPLWLSAADSIELGATEIRISSAPGATVAATQGPRLLGATLCDEHRSTLLTFEAIDDTTPITLTATGPQMAPVAVTVRVTLPHGRAALLHGIETSDTSLSFQLTNTGTDTLCGLRVALAPDSLGATYNTDSISVDTLLPQASKHLAMSVGVTRWGRWWGGTLAVIGAYDDTLCSAAVAHWLHDTLPTLSFTVATADGRRINAIEPRTTYLLTAMAAGPHDSLSIHITSLPLGESLCAETSTADRHDTLHCTIITPDSVTHLHIEASVHRGNYVKQYSYYLEAGSRTPASGGLLGCYPWRNKEPQPWCVDSTTAHSGAASLRSGDIDYRQQSDLWLDVLLPQADSIVFWAKSSTEPTYDKLTFEVDGIVKNQLWGEYNWRRYAVALSAGSHTLRWHYHKDDADDGGSDCVWIDDVHLPMVGDSIRFVIDTVCQGTSYEFGNLGELPTDQLGHYSYSDTLATAYLSLLVTPQPQVHIEVIGTPALGQCLLLKATGASNYVWNTGDSAECIAVCPEEGSHYSVTGYRGGCEGSDQITLLGISQAGEASPVSVFPNPARGSVTVQADNIRHVWLINLMGQTVMRSDVHASRLTLPLQNLPEGVYFIKVETLESVSTQKLIIK